MFNKKTILDGNFNEKRVLVRVDFNVPLDSKTHEVKDDRRIVESLPTIKYLLEKNAKVILISHLGRPKGVDDSLRMKPVAEKLSVLLSRPVFYLTDCIGDKVQTFISRMAPGEVLLLENVRFYKEEEKNDENFAKRLAELADIYVNDAFGTSHRAHASTATIAKFLPAYAGFLIKKELDYLGTLLTNPESPFTAILGGLKVSDKIMVIENLLNKVESLIIGGAMAFTFLKALSKETGLSPVENDKLDIAKKIIYTASQKKVNLILPVDFLVVVSPDKPETKKIVTTDKFPEDMTGVDIGPESIKLFQKIIKESKTVFWNGPMGIFETRDYADGTKGVAEAISDERIISIIGGGDTASAVLELGYANKIKHISTGGGASLEFLEGKVLPGIDVLLEK